MDNKPVTAIILAGGKSSRMRRDKGLMLFQGKPMIQHILDHVVPITKDIIIVTGNTAYQQFGVTCIPDIYKNIGPLGGIFSGLEYSGTQRNLVLSCDTPFVTTELLQYLILQSGEAEVAVAAHGNNIEPLVAVYDRGILPKLMQCINAGELKMMHVLSQLNMVKINFDIFEDRMNTAFVNMNTPDDIAPFQNNTHEK